MRLCLISSHMEPPSLAGARYSQITHPLTPSTVVRSNLQDARNVEIHALGQCLDPYRLGEHSRSSATERHHVVEPRETARELDYSHQHIVQCDVDHQCNDQEPGAENRECWNRLYRAGYLV